MVIKTELTNIPDLLIDQYEFDYVDNFYDGFEVTSNWETKTFLTLTDAIQYAQNIGMNNGIVTVYGLY